MQRVKNQKRIKNIHHHHHLQNSNRLIIRYNQPSLSPCTIPKMPLPIVVTCVVVLHVSPLSEMRMLTSINKTMQMQNQHWNLNRYPKTIIASSPLLPLFLHLLLRMQDTLIGLGHKREDWWINMDPFVWNLRRNMMGQGQTYDTTKEKSEL